MSSGRGPLDGRRAEEWRRARARASRQHHPDLGGDVHIYLDALRAVDAQFGVGDFGTTHVQVHLDRSPWARLAHARVRARRAARRVIAHLPRRWRPGPTYIDL
ncbi:MAG: hypothetical protein ABJA33_04995 [Pedococcus sp.]